MPIRRTLPTPIPVKATSIRDGWPSSLSSLVLQVLIVKIFIYSFCVRFSIICWTNQNSRSQLTSSWCQTLARWKARESMWEQNAGKYVTTCKGGETIDFDWLQKSSLSIKYETYSTSNVWRKKKKNHPSDWLWCATSSKFSQQKKMREEEVGRKLEGTCT